MISCESGTGWKVRTGVVGAYGLFCCGASMMVWWMILRKYQLFSWKWVQMWKGNRIWFMGEKGHLMLCWNDRGECEVNWKWVTDGQTYRWWQLRPAFRLKCSCWNTVCMGHGRQAGCSKALTKFGHQLGCVSCSMLHWRNKKLARSRVIYVWCSFYIEESQQEYCQLSVNY